MCDFRDITLDDRSLVELYTFRAGIANCDLAFANIFCWRDTYSPALAIIDGFLVIRFRAEDGCTSYMQPLGEGDFTRIIPVLHDDACARGARLRIAGLTAEGAELLRSRFGGRFAFSARRASDDYIYRADDLRSLHGSRYQPKRNHINRFMQLYGDLWRYDELTPELFGECMRLEAQWSLGHSGDGVTAERRAMEQAFANFGALGLRGGCIHVGDRMAAFTLGSAIDRSTFCIHIEKADTCFEGAFAVINKLFAESLPAHYTSINREEDLGLEGLRRAKLSYHPERLWRKFTAVSLQPDESECRSLWAECFGDDEEFIDSFIVEIYSRERMLTIVEDGRMVSMLHIIPMQSRYGRTAYIYGVATAAGFRRRGHAGRLLQRAVERVDSEGYDAAILIPAGGSLCSFYSRYGFSDAGLPVVFAGDFDFGTGAADLDRAMVRMRGGAAFDGDSSTLECTFAG